MRLYRNDSMIAAAQWAGTQDDANKLFGRGRWELVEVPTDKPGLIAWLNALSADAPQAAPETAPQSPPAPPQASIEPPAYVVSLATDEAFLALPLPHQLHLAALAVENARSRIRPSACSSAKPVPQ